MNIYNDRVLKWVNIEIRIERAAALEHDSIPFTGHTLEVWET